MTDSLSYPPGALDRGATVVTATARLSRELANEYDRHQFDLTQQAWPSADVLPWQAWVERLWDALLPLLADPPVILSDNQLELVWLRVIEQDIANHASDSRPLWNARATARFAMRTNRLVHAWLISRSDLGRSRHPDHVNFARWHDAFNRHCEAFKVCDSAALPDMIARSSATDELLAMLDIAIAGFDRITPQQRALLDRVIDVGGQVQFLKPLSGDRTRRTVRCYRNSQTQWLAAGQWARDYLKRKPSARIAIVLPDLASAREQLDHALKQILYTEDLMRPGESSRLPWDFSLGIPLTNQPAVGAAMSILELLCHPTSGSDKVTEVLTSVFLGGSEIEGLARARQSQQLLNKLAFEAGLDSVCDALIALDPEARSTIPILLGNLLSVRKKIDSRESRASYACQSETLSALLDLMGWPGDLPLNSDSYQAVDAFRTELRTLCCLDLVATEVGLKQALQQLRLQVQHRIFQPESSDAPIQVLGVVETAGMTFDAIWFADLTDQIWPPATRPDPFLPVELQRQAGIAEADSALNSSLAQQQLQRLMSSATDLVLSRPLEDNETPLGPSGVIADFAVEKPVDIPMPTLMQQHCLAAPEFETVRETTGPSLTTPGKIAGGAGLIKAQSQCPRGAFLRYRLQALPIAQSVQGLDAARRGSLVHHVLESIWSELKTSLGLHALSPVMLADLIDKHIAQQSRKYWHTSGCGRGFFATQQVWLGETLKEWFALELQREQAFEVLKLEQKTELQLGPVELEFFIDRIDRLEDGSLALIDYKTGGTVSPDDWVDPRPNHPQLPLYRLTQEHPVSVISFATVRRGECSFKGIIREGDFINGSRSSSVKAFEKQKRLVDKFNDWETMEEFWDSTLKQLAREFAEGDARIDPRNDGLCRHCLTPAFCRSISLTGEAEERADDVFAG